MQQLNTSAHKGNRGRYCLGLPLCLLTHGNLRVWRFAVAQLRWRRGFSVFPLSLPLPPAPTTLLFSYTVLKQVRLHSFPQYNATEVPVLRYISFLMLCLTLVGCSRRETREEKYPDGSTKERFTVTQDGDGNFVKDGLFESWNDNGQKLVEGSYSDGKKDGQWKYWRTTGGLRLRGKFRDDKEEGVWTAYAPSGEKEAEVEFQRGHFYGKGTMWGDGKKVFEGEYLAGSRHGIFYAYLPNGEQRYKFFALNDRLDPQYLVSDAWAFAVKFTQTDDPREDYKRHTFSTTIP